MFYDENVINNILEDAEEIEKNYEYTSEDINNDIGIVKCRLNLRENPSKESNILCVLKKDSTVEILEEIYEWFKVVTESGMEGYCMRDFIDAEIGD